MVCNLQDRVEEAVETIRRGEMIVVADDDAREGEGDLLMAADAISPQAINFMAAYGRGLICLPMGGTQIDRLGLPQMVTRGQCPLGTAFTVSIDARHGVTTGISAADRAKTIQVAADGDSDPYDLNAPGHVFPLRARPGGVLERGGHTEAAVDLTLLAGRAPSGVICEIMNPDGTMAKGEEIRRFADTFSMPVIMVKELATYRRRIAVDLEAKLSSS